MRPIQIEGWALDIIDRVESGQPNEDSRVELKSNWISPEKAARRLAGHANSARGEPILWLIGVDEEKGVVGAPKKELAEWFDKVKSEFDGIAPSLTDIVIPYNNETVVALFFETHRAPYVIKVSSFGTIAGVSASYEVPWREDTKIRTARRSDLVKILIPIAALPEIELLSGKLLLSERQNEYHWGLEFEFYIVPEIDSFFSIPYHHCEVSFQVDNVIKRTIMNEVKLLPAFKPTADIPFSINAPVDSCTINYSSHELIIYGPGYFRLKSYHVSNKVASSLKDTQSTIFVKITPTHIDRSIILEYKMKWRDTDEKHIGLWKVA